MIYPVFHPIMDLQDRRVAWRESLARIQGDENPLAHGALLGSAERNGVIQHIDLAMLSQVIGLTPRLDAPASVNLSSQTIEYGASAIVEALEQGEAARKKLIFEITEVTPIRDIPNLLRFRDRLRDFDVLLAVDDFGSGIWTDQLVTRIEPDIVKVSWKCGAVDAALEIASEINADVVVEYVDSERVLDAVRAKGIRFAQGYLFGKPCALPAHEPFPPIPFPQELPCVV